MPAFLAVMYCNTMPVVSVIVWAPALFIIIIIIIIISSYHHHIIIIIIIIIISVGEKVPVTFVNGNGVNDELHVRVIVATVKEGGTTISVP